MSYAAKSLDKHREGSGGVFSVELPIPSQAEKGQGNGLRGSPKLRR